MRFPGTRRFVLRYLAGILHWVLRVYASTLRMQRPDYTVLRRALEDGPVLYVFFHNRILFMPWSLPWVKPYRPVCMLISASEDGSLISQAVSGLGVRPVRGSSSRRGADARTELLTSLQQGSNAGVTPDGPKGPVLQVKAGAAWLAREAGVPVVSICYTASRAWRFGTWDRFLLPMPFSRITFDLSDPLDVQGLEFDEACQAIETSMVQQLRRLDPHDPSLVSYMATGGCA